MSLAGNTTKWGLLSSFSRQNQIGANVTGHWLSFSHLKKAMHTIDFASPTDVEHGMEGEVLSSMLLLHFLEALGVNPNAMLQGMSAEWADAAMQQRDLVR